MNRCFELAAIVLAGAVLGCNGAGASSGSSPAALTATSAASAAPPASPAPSSSPPASVTSSAPVSVTAPGPGTASVPSGAVWTYPGSLSAGSAPGSSAASSTGIVLSGTVPPDPTTAFSGILFITGERIVPGSTVLVSFQGAPVALLPGIFTSSEVLGIDTVFLTAGAYTLTVVAPDGTTSAPLALPVTSAGPSGVLTIADPDLQMIWPPSFDTTFVGTVWILGDSFLPGATLVGSGPTGPFVAPLLYVNECTLGWVTATPVAGNYTLQVTNSTTLLTSTAVTITVGAPASPGPGFAAPGLVYAQPSVASPFLGTVRVFGSDFLPGAVLELTDSSGNTTSTPLLFVASDEVWWVLVYPSTGTYQALVRNPDGQATPSWAFTVN